MDGSVGSGSYKLRVYSIAGTYVDVTIDKFKNEGIFFSGKEFAVPTTKFNPTTLLPDDGSSGSKTPEPEPQPQPQSDPKPSGGQKVYVYQNGCAAYWEVLNGPSTKTYCTSQSTKTCSISATYNAWQDFLVYTYKE